MMKDISHTPAEALEQVKEIARTIYSTSDKGTHHEALAEKIVELANAALAEPVRNCEVGTADEQFKRHCKWCARTKDFSCAPTMCRKCFANWAQMPYEEDGNDNSKVHAAVSIMGRESIHKQCWECDNCKEPTGGWDRSKFRCAFLTKDFDTWHYDVPNECPCKGRGWIPKKKEGDLE